MKTEDGDARPTPRARRSTTTPSCPTSRPTPSSSFDKRNGLVGHRLPASSSTAARSARGPTSIRRVELGKLIADPKNDDLARAFVNRMWGHFMGRGFVNPVDDFGPHNPPSHPELLDKLGAGVPGERLRRQAPDPLDHGQPGLPAHAASMTKGNEKDETLFSHMR